MEPYSIEFIRKVAGRAEPAVLEVINAFNAAQLDGVIKHAQSLPRPAGTEGFQIRKNGGPVSYTMWFQ
jgi:hypothetical protein